MKPGHLLLILVSGGLLLWAAGEACGPGGCSAVPPAPAGPPGPAARSASATTAVFRVDGLKKTASGAT